MQDGNLVNKMHCYEHRTCQHSSGNCFCTAVCRGSLCTAQWTQVISGEKQPALLMYFQWADLRVCMWVGEGVVGLGLSGWCTALIDSIISCRELSQGGCARLCAAVWWVQTSRWCSCFILKIAHFLTHIQTHTLFSCENQTVWGNTTHPGQMIEDVEIASFELQPLLHSHSLLSATGCKAPVFAPGTNCLLSCEFGRLQ